MIKNKIRITRVAAVLLAMGCSFSIAEAQSASEKSPPEKGLTLVDSATLTCNSKVSLKVVCEYYLVYDTRDDIIYVIRRPNRKTDHSFGATRLKRERIQHDALQTIDLVSVFSEKKVGVQNYAAMFNKHQGKLQIKVSVLFDDEITRLEKFIEIKLH